MPAKIGRQAGSGPIKRRVALKKRRRQATDRQAAEQWKADIEGLPCAQCGATEGIQAHHPLKQQWLRVAAAMLGLDFEALRWDQRNRMPVCETCHSRHHLAVRRISRGVLVAACPRVFEMAGELSLVAQLEREYSDHVNETKETIHD